MEATFSKKENTRKAKTKKSRKSHTWWDPCNHSLNFTCVNYFGAFHLDGFSII
ncbi:hypothetical protein EfsSVR2281_29940 [Enterococcus faecalis]|nr:hypothetical protein EfsSVR2281_29940 [Enterococcus faecalis]